MSCSFNNSQGFLLGFIFNLHQEVIKCVSLLQVLFRGRARGKGRQRVGLLCCNSFSGLLWCHRGSLLMMTWDLKHVIVSVTQLRLWARVRWVPGTQRWGGRVLLLLQTWVAKLVVKPFMTMPFPEALCLTCFIGLNWTRSGWVLGWNCSLKVLAVI